MWAFVGLGLAAPLVALFSVLVTTGSDPIAPAAGEVSPQRPQNGLPTQPAQIQRESREQDAQRAIRTA
ncbi:hypothetical protein GTC6_03470 [Gordonia terrae C-6]|uniref:Uncharacterized protein n=1 Tax=Gordonia terrae C-6 TaxID=1316928 RepID=R7YDZ2_9ACTN|nr:hypothetical protein GTC6_03470 [Gordonia terrae C-6]